MYDTTNPKIKDPNDTSFCPEVDPNNYNTYGYAYNRETRRYAKKHNLSLEQAFKKLYNV